MISFWSLLGREEVKDVMLTFNGSSFETGKRVLITVAGGSIGSGLVKKLFKFSSFKK